MTTYTTAGAILTWPAAIRPNSLTVHLQANTSAFTSPFTRTVQAQELPGALFQLSATFPALRDAAADQARTLLARLRGRAGRFYFPVSRAGFAIPSAYESERVTVVALTADATKITSDSTIVTSDASRIRLESVFSPTGAGTDATRLPGHLLINSNQRPLQAGQYISWDDSTGWRHLHLVVDIESIVPTTGAMTLVLEPPMRSRPTGATPVHVTYPSAVFMLTGDDVGAQALTPGGFATGLSIQAVQAFPLAITL